jgi:hypothetical protein
VVQMFRLTEDLGKPPDAKIHREFWRKIDLKA